MWCGIYVFLGLIGIVYGWFYLLEDFIEEIGVLVGFFYRDVKWEFVILEFKDVLVISNSVGCCGIFMDVRI